MRTHTSVAVLALALAACSMESVEDELDVDDTELRGLKFANGLKLANGLKFANGLKLANGVALDSGLASGTGLSVAHALSTEAGLSSTNGFMTSEEGQAVVKYLVECALPAGTSITKNDPVHGGTRTFAGAMGLASAWRTGACTATCQEAVSACLLARTNEIGEHVLIDMRSPMAAIGTAASGPEFVIQEGAFFGNLFANPPRMHACKGVDGSFGMFEGRTCANAGSCGITGLEGHCLDSCVPAPGQTFASCKVGTTKYSSVITTYLDPSPWSVDCPPGCDACYDGTCTMICTAGQPCAAMTLDCPADWGCEILCDGSSACGASFFDCSGATECAVTCTSDNSCGGAALLCGEGDCDMTCQTKRACTGVTVATAHTGAARVSCSASTASLQCVDDGSGSCTTSGC